MSRLVACWLTLNLLCVLLGGRAKGQSSLVLQGTVTDTAGRLLPMVTVRLSEVGSSSIRAFVNTGVRGEYRLVLPAAAASAYLLTVQSLGYAPQVVRIEAGTIQAAYNIVLRPAIQTLREVLVRAPIVQRNDTTSFDLKQFADTTSSEKLESVLKRLPGFDVNEAGQVYFKGKRVEKLLLDGDDLFDDRYAVATRSLRANLIDKVQAIDGYQKNQLLKGFKRSDNVAVNLVMRPDKRKVLTGSIDLTTNFGDRYQAQINAISYTKTLKGMWIGDATSIAAETTSPGAIRQPANDGEQPLPSLLQTTATNSLNYLLPNGLRASRFLNSRTQSGAASLAAAWSKTIKSSAYVVGYANQNQFSKHTDEQYLRLPVEFAIREQQTNSQAGQFLTGQHELTVDLSKRTQVLVLTHGQYEPRTYTHSIYSSLTPAPIQEQLRSVPFLVVQRVSGTHRINDSYAFQASVQYIAHQLHQAFTVPILTQTDSTTNGQYLPVNQTNQLTRRELSGVAEWLWRGKNGFSGDVQADLTQTWQQQVTSTVPIPEDSSRTAPPGQLFTLAHQLQHLRATLRRTINRTQLSVGLTGSFARASYGQTSSATKLVGPVLTVRHTFSASSQLLLSYRYELSDQTLQQYYPGILLTGYRSRYQGLDTTAFWGEHLVFASVNKQDLLANRRFGLTAILSHRENTIRNELNINPYQLQQRIALAGRTLDFVTVTGTAEQLIVPLSLVLKGNLGYTSLIRYNRINGQDQVIRSIGRNVGFEVNTVLDKPFTVNLSSQYGVNETRLEQAGNQQVLQTRNWLFQEKITAKLGHLRLRFSGQQVYSYGGGTTGQSQFFDANADYTLNRKGVTVALECRNLLNEQQYTVQTVGDLSATATRYDVLGRWLLVSCSFPF